LAASWTFANCSAGFIAAIIIIAIVATRPMTTRSSTKVNALLDINPY